MPADRSVNIGEAISHTAALESKGGGSMVGWGSVGGGGGCVMCRGYCSGEQCGGICHGSCVLLSDC